MLKNEDFSHYPMKIDESGTNYSSLSEFLIANFKVTVVEVATNGQASITKASELILKNPLKLKAKQHELTGLRQKML